MVDPPSSPTTPPTLPKSYLPMMYYGLIVVATTAILLVLYNIVVVKWCTHHRLPQSNLRRQGTTPIWRVNDSTLNFLSSFKYKKDDKSQDGGSDSECAVCLSVFEEGDEVRQLPKCNHYFHAPCIDMWLHSHMDCPLCRSTVEPSGTHSHDAAEELEHSREGLLGPVALV